MGYNQPILSYFGRGRLSGLGETVQVAFDVDLTSSVQQSAAADETNFKYVLNTERPAVMGDLKDAEKKADLDAIGKIGYLAMQKVSGLLGRAEQVYQQTPVPTGFISLVQNYGGRDKLLQSNLANPTAVMDFAQAIFDQERESGGFDANRVNDFYTAMMPWVWPTIRLWADTYVLSKQSWKKASTQVSEYQRQLALKRAADLFMESLPKLSRQLLPSFVPGPAHTLVSMPGIVSFMSLAAGKKAATAAAEAKKAVGEAALAISANKSMGQQTSGNGAPVSVSQKADTAERTGRANKDATKAASAASKAESAAVKAVTLDQATLDLQGKQKSLEDIVRDASQKAASTGSDTERARLQKEAADAKAQADALAKQIADLKKAAEAAAKEAERQKALALAAASSAKNIAEKTTWKDYAKKYGPWVVGSALLLGVGYYAYTARAAAPVGQ